jgi:hypothetical protein
MMRVWISKWLYARKEIADKGISRIPDIGDLSAIAEKNQG